MASTVSPAIIRGSTTPLIHAEGCGYQKDGSGICNSTMFGYPMEPLSQLVADTPAAFKMQVADIIPSSTFKNNTYNHNMSRAGSLMLFVSPSSRTLAYARSARASPCCP